MASLYSLPNELLINIVNLVFEKTGYLSTEMLLLNKNLCHLMMLRQISSLRLKERNIRTWLNTIEDKDKIWQQSSTTLSSITYYRQLLDQIHDLELDSIRQRSLYPRLINFVRRCTNLRKIVFNKLAGIDKICQTGVLPPNIISIHIDMEDGFIMPKYPRYLPEYLQKNTELRVLKVSGVYTVKFYYFLYKREAKCNYIISLDYVGEFDENYFSDILQAIKQNLKLTELIFISKFKYLHLRYKLESNGLSFVFLRWQTFQFQCMYYGRMVKF